MTAETVRIQRAGDPDAYIVVTTPPEIDLANADRVRDVLLRALNTSARTLIIDMSATCFSDITGVRAIESAHARALTRGTQVRLVVTASVLWRLFAVTGVHRLVGIYPSLAAARPAPGGGHPVRR